MSEIEKVFKVPLRAINELELTREFKEQVSALLILEVIIFLNSTFIPQSWRVYKNIGPKKSPSNLWSQFTDRVEKRSGY